MLRISKLTDYGIVLLAHLAGRKPGATRTARELSEETSLPFPVVGKMLKTLAAADLLQSHRGSKGGYSLARPPREVSVAEIIEAVEGPIALMACTVGPGHCEQEPSCPVSEPWQLINRAIQETLRGVTLDRLVRPGPSGLLQLSEGIHRETSATAGAS